MEYSQWGPGPLLTAVREPLSSCSSSASLYLQGCR